MLKRKLKQSDFTKRVFNRKMLSILFLGIASGVPLGVVITIFQTWTTESGIDLKTISLAGLTQLPYTWKFVWSPLMDRFRMPFLGRRRGWMLVSQIVMLISIFMLGQFDPKSSLSIVIALATLVSFAGASHDIVIDAYRRDVLDDQELGFGSALATNSYLIGYRYLTVVSGLVIADILPWAETFAILSSFTLIGIVGTFIAPDFEGKIAAPKSLREAVIAPFREFLQRPGSFEILLFILLYKVGDNMGQHMLQPFYLKLGYTKTEIGIVGKVVGFWATFAGGFVGGFVLLRYSIRNSLLWFGVLQAISTFSFVALIGHAPDKLLLGVVVGFENLTSGMGTAAFGAFMLKLTNRKFSATQFALLSSLMGVPRVVVPALVGTSLEYISWNTYFSICTLAAIPGLIMIVTRAKKWERAS